MRRKGKSSKGEEEPLLQTVTAIICSRCLDGAEADGPHGSQLCRTEGCLLEQEKRPYLSLREKVSER